MGCLGGVLGNYDSGEHYVRKKEMRVDRKMGREY